MFELYIVDMLFDFVMPLSMGFGSSGGGGSSAGSVDYPAYIENAFKDIWGTWIGDAVTNPNENLVDIADAMWTSGGSDQNPFSGESAYNPGSIPTSLGDSPIGKMRTVQSDYSTFYKALDQETDWNDIIDNVVTQVDSKTNSWAGINTAITAIVTTALTDSGLLVSGAVTAAAGVLNNAAITAAVSAYESNKLPAHLRGVARLSAGYADINSVNSTGFIWAMALAEFEFSKEVSDFQAKLNLEAYNGSFRSYVEAYVMKIKDHMMTRNVFEENRVKYINFNIAQSMDILTKKLGAYQSDVQLVVELERILLTALKEQTDRDLEIDTAYSRWDMNTLIQMSNVLASIAGGTAGPVMPNPTPLQSALGGAMVGAATGFAIGGPIGAVVGGIGGLFM